MRISDWSSDVCSSDLVEVVLALRLLHLPLDAVPDALLDLENVDLAFHVGVDPFQPLLHPGYLEEFLLLGALQGQMGRDRVAELRWVVDLVDRYQHLRRDLIFQYLKTNILTSIHYSESR